MARPPKPTRVKELQGTLRKHRENPAEWKPPEGAPPCPSHLAGAALELWRFLVGHMSASGVVTSVDGVALEGFCVAYARAVEADKAIKKKGLIVKTPYGQQYANPALKVSKDAWAQVDTFGSKLGLSPAARRSISVPEKPKEPDRSPTPLRGPPRLTSVPGGGGA